MQTQSSAAISKLQTDNQNLNALKTAVSNFNAGEELKGTSIRGMKQQLSDYLTVIDAEITANDVDIEDFQTLSSAAGGEVIDGTAILDEWDRAKEGKASAERSADNATGWALFFRIMQQMDTARILESNAKVYDNQADTWQEIITWCQEQADKFDEIQSATDGLFVTGAALRDAATSALADIAGAFQVNGYIPNMDAIWRSKILNKPSLQAIDKTIGEIKLLYPKLTDDEITKIKDLYYKNPLRPDEDEDAYLERISSKLLEIPGITISGIQIILDKTAGVYSKQVSWLSEEAAKALSYTDDMAQYIDDVGNAAKVAEVGRQFAAYGKIMPVVGVAIDFGVQVVTGENAKDAAVKTGAHVVAGVIGTAIVGAVIGATPVGWAAVAAVGIGMALGAGFDYVYDNYGNDIAKNMKKAGKKIEEFANDVGTAVSGFFSGVSEVFA